MGNPPSSLAARFIPRSSRAIPGLRRAAADALLRHHAPSQQGRVVLPPTAPSAPVGWLVRCVRRLFVRWMVGAARAPPRLTSDWWHGPPGTARNSPLWAAG